MTRLWKCTKCGRTEPWRKPHITATCQCKPNIPRTTRMTLIDTETGGK